MARKASAERFVSRISEGTDQPDTAAEGEHDRDFGFPDTGSPRIASRERCSDAPALPRVLGEGPGHPIQKAVNVTVVASRAACTRRAITVSPTRWCSTP